MEVPDTIGAERVLVENVYLQQLVARQLADVERKLCLVQSLRYVLAQHEVPYGSGMRTHTHTQRKRGRDPLDDECEEATDLASCAYLTTHSPSPPPPRLIVEPFRDAGLYCRSAFPVARLAPLPDTRSAASRLARERVFPPIQARRPETAAERAASEARAHQVCTAAFGDTLEFPEREGSRVKVPSHVAGQPAPLSHFLQRHRELVSSLTAAHWGDTSALGYHLFSTMVDMAAVESAPPQRLATLLRTFCCPTVSNAQQMLLEEAYTSMATCSDRDLFENSRLALVSNFVAHALLYNRKKNVSVAWLAVFVAICLESGVFKQAKPFLQSEAISLAAGSARLLSISSLLLSWKRHMTIL